MEIKTIKKSPDTPLYKIGGEISFSHNISNHKFVITSFARKNIISSETGKSINYHIYGIEIAPGQNLSERDIGLNFFATYANGGIKAFGRTASGATISLLNKLRDNRQI